MDCQGSLPRSVWRAFRPFGTLPLSKFQGLTRAAVSLIEKSQHMRKILSAVFNTCLWMALLVLIVVGVARMGVESTERRSQPHVVQLQR